MNTLRIYFSGLWRDASSPCPWVLCDRHGAVLQSGNDPLAALPKAAECIAIAAADRVLFTSAKLPPGSRRKWAAALPFAAEEHTLNDPEDNTGSSVMDDGGTGANQLGAQIRRTVERVNDGLVVGVERDGVDGEVTFADVIFEIGSAIGGEIEEGTRAVRVGEDDASGVAFFAVRLQDAEGVWQSAWDSWSPAQSSALPFAAEVRIALLPEGEPDEEALLEAEPPVYARPLVLALEPLDLEKALTGETAEEGEEEEDLACVTVSECVSRNQAAVDAFLAANPDAREILASLADQCWNDHAGSVPVPVENFE